MYYLIFTIIIITAYLYFRKVSIKNDIKETDYLMIAIIVVFWIRYFFDYMYAVEEYEFTRMELTVGYMISNSLIPLGYIYVCKHCNIKIASATTVGIFSMILFNIFSKGTVYLDWYPCDNPINEPGIHFYRKGHQLISMHTFEVVELFQTAWIFVRTFMLWKKTSSNNYKTSQKGKIAFYAISATLVFILIETFLNESFRLKPAVLVIHYTVHLSFAIVLIRLVAHGYLNEIIIDQNEEMAYLEVTPKYMDLKMKLDIIMHEKKLYLDKNIGIETLARQLNTNRTYLAQTIKEAYDTNFTGYINYLRVEEAKRIIRGKKASKLEEVASLCGFSSASSFTRTFKSITGVTPHMWR